MKFVRGWVVNGHCSAPLWGFVILFLILNVEGECVITKPWTLKCNKYLIAISFTLCIKVSLLLHSIHFLRFSVSVYGYTCFFENCGKGSHWSTGEYLMSDSADLTEMENVADWLICRVYCVLLPHIPSHYCMCFWVSLRWKRIDHTEYKIHWRFSMYPCFYNWCNSCLGEFWLVIHHCFFLSLDLVSHINLPSIWW